MGLRVLILKTVPLSYCTVMNSGKFWIPPHENAKGGRVRINEPPEYLPTINVSSSSVHESVPVPGGWRCWESNFKLQAGALFCSLRKSFQSILKNYNFTKCLKFSGSEGIATRRLIQNRFSSRR